jgi:hypothetical protein
MKQKIHTLLQAVSNYLPKWVRTVLYVLATASFEYIEVEQLGVDLYSVTKKNLITGIETTLLLKVPQHS